MYTPPENFDCGLLTGCYLEMVCFGPRVTRLDFARPQPAPGVVPYKVVFAIEGTLNYRAANIPGERKHSIPQTCAPLLNFLLQDVVTVSRFGDAGIRIDFGGNGTIEMNADDDATTISPFEPSSGKYWSKYSQE